MTRSMCSRSVCPKSIPSDVDLSKFLVSIDDIEDETGIDFLHELSDELEDALEKVVWDLWPDVAEEG